MQQILLQAKVLTGADVLCIHKGEPARGLHLVHHRQELTDFLHLVAPLALAFFMLVAPVVLALHSQLEGAALREASLFGGLTRRGVSMGGAEVATFRDELDLCAGSHLNDPVDSLVNDADLIKTKQNQKQLQQTL
ncbi:MAG: hypothetical protein FRX49_08923 [Trebouxia sp. A1-2]|nr:MAG: hypothetical protein FRX49_08923 [Trebouxia sp. A1-2]